MGERYEALIEAVAEALYDRAMTERRFFCPGDADRMYSDPWSALEEGDTRSGWLDEARAALAGVRSDG